MLPLLTVTDRSIRLRRNTDSQTLVHNVSFSLNAGECLGIVGESGAGKTLTVRSLFGLLPPNFQSTGQVRFRGQVIENVAFPQHCPLLGRELLYLVQQPMTAFDPLLRLGFQLDESAKIALPDHCQSDRHHVIVDALRRLRFTNPESVLQRFPCELSGGMLQRAMLAVTLIVRPSLLVADEPTSALDVLSGREVITELRRLRTELGASLILISHDLSVVQSLCSRILVMKKGTVIEAGDADLLLNPQTDYTRYLVQTHNQMTYHFNRLTKRTV